MATTVTTATITKAIYMHTRVYAWLNIWHQKVSANITSCYLNRNTNIHTTVQQIINPQNWLTEFHAKTL